MLSTRAGVFALNDVIVLTMFAVSSIAFTWQLRQWFDNKCQEIIATSFKIPHLASILRWNAVSIQSWPYGRLPLCTLGINHENSRITSGHSKTDIIWRARRKPKWTRSVLKYCNKTWKKIRNKTAPWMYNRVLILCATKFSWLRPTCASLVISVGTVVSIASVWLVCWTADIVETLALANVDIIRVRRSARSFLDCW